MRNIVDNFLSGMSHALANITKKIDFIAIYDIVKCLFGITKG